MPICLASRLLGIVFGFNLLLGNLASAQDQNQVAKIVEMAAKSFTSDPSFVGVSIGVIKDDNQRTFNYGVTSPGGRAPSENTIYPIASITKTFAGTLLAMAEVEGKLRLDDDVRKYVKGDYPNLEFEGKAIRLSDLINHRSGLPFLLPDRPELMPGYQNEPITKHLDRTNKALREYSRDQFYADLHKVKLPFAPGKQFQYSNAGSQLAGYILESIHGVPFEKLVSEKINRQLGMTDTLITLDSSQRARLAPGYDDNKAKLPPPNDELQAAGALKSTVSDLLKYAQWHLADTDKAIRLTHKPTFTQNNYSAGLNWQILTAESRRLIWQEGNVPGYTCYLILEPELKIGLVILTNESDRSSSQRISKMANEILKELDERAVLLP